MKYWEKKINNKEKVFLNDKTKKIDISVSVEKEKLNYFFKITDKNLTAQITVLNAIYSFLLKRLIYEFDGFITSNLTTQNTPLLLSYPLDLNLSFKEYLKMVKLEILTTLNNSNFTNNLIEKNIHLKDLILFSNYSININASFDNEFNGLLFDVKISDEQDLKIQVSYIEECVNPSIVYYLINHFKEFLIHLETNIEVNLSKYSLLTDKEKKHLHVDFNNTYVDYPKNKTIVDLFEEQVIKSPDNIAVIFQQSTLSFKELNEKANQLAHCISSKHHINIGDIVAVFLPKSDIGIMATLAILKLGATYLPIDKNYPQDRIDYLIKDSGLKLLISDELILTDPKCDFINIDLEDLEDYSNQNLDTKISPNNLAYIIYTSGSTGLPKGVMVEHTSNVNMSLDQIRSFEINENDRVVWFASVSFDASISEMMMCLYKGATLCIPTEETIKNKDKFVRFLKETESTVVTLPPSYLGLLTIDDLFGLRCIITAGESANPYKAIEVLESGIDYYNAYGPTECAVCVSIYKVTKNDINKSILPIGSPISNTQIYIVDDNLEPVPIGITGKIYIAGAGLARGYLNKPELTSEKFISNPFIDGERMYDSGDLGRWLPDGNIDFLGRKDNQVKIRGYRIELGEIENTILLFSHTLKQVVVQVKENNNEKVLVAYFVANSDIDKTLLREFLQNKLPDYMMPSFYVVLKALPLTPNGKIDLKALPSISQEDIIRKKYVAPRNKNETILVSIWEEVLGIEKIGITDNFFELGGHSLMFAQVINRIHKQLGKSISFKTFFAHPTIKELSSELSENTYIPIPKAPQLENYPLTASQNRLWVLSQFEGGSLAYNMPGAVKLIGELDFNKLQQSFLLLFNQYEILRTAFKTNNQGIVMQHILPLEQVEFVIEQNDFSKSTIHEIENLLQEKNNIPFDLERTPLLRASLIKVKENQHIFFLSLHHIIGDGWSMELLINQVIKTYNALASNQTVNLPVLNIQYKDYAVWLNEQLQHQNYRDNEQYWLKQFEGELPVLDLPSFKKRPLVQTYNGDNISQQFSNSFLNKLKSFSKEKDVTLFMTLMTGINVLLHRYTNQDDIIIGTPIAGREHPDLENQLGLFLNTLAIRTHIKKNNSFLDLLISQKENLSNAYDNQNYPFDALVDKLNLKRDTSRSALFDVMVVLQNQNQLNNGSDQKLNNIQIEGFDFQRKTSQIDVSFTFVETDQLGLTIEYNTDIYDSFFIERMFPHFENLLIQLIDNPQKKLHEVDYLSKDEINQLVFDFNDTKIEYPKDKTIIDLFEQQVKKNPKNTAVIFQDTQLTYKELNEKANQLAAYLRENYQILPDDLVGIKLDRSEQMIVSILGILKSGAAYVPIDPTYPEERINYIEKNSNAKIIIDRFELEKFYKVYNKYPKSNIPKTNKPSDLAYVIYTSGTTGNPKGVMIEHHSLLDYIITFINYFKVISSDAVLSQSTISFDTSIEEIFPILNVGGKLVIVEDNKDFTSVFSLCEKHEITILSTNPFMIDFLNSNAKNDLFSLKKIISGGDVLKPEYIDKIKDKVFIYNTYGPTETTVCSTYYAINRFSFILSIGSPISNTQIYIVDDNLEPVPIGITGKIYIAGAGLARGYLNKPELTSEKFISNPFIDGERMYDSGDLGRWLPDGNIDFLGRKDNQVKIRGYRIELGEIENTILLFSHTLKQVVVQVKENNNEKVLVAYFVANSDIDKTLLREFLQNKLPDYMVPSFYVVLKALPLTPNGKIDLKALPSISQEDIIRKKYVAPNNDTQKRLISIWQEVLNVDEISITDNFFELGGHSLSATKIIGLIYFEFKVKISINDFFENMILEEQANLINKINLLLSMENEYNQNPNDFEKFEL